MSDLVPLLLNKEDAHIETEPILESHIKAEVAAD